MATKKDNSSSVGGLLFSGCMFLGAGIGYLVNNSWVVGGAIGMGVGFIVMALVPPLLQKKSK